MRLLSFIRAFFQWRRASPTRPTLAQPGNSTDGPAAEVAPLPPPTAAAGDPPCELPDEDEDDWRDDEDEDDPDAGPDPFISGAATVFELPADVAALRQRARADALAGEHKLPLASPAGPGSLAEALNELIAEGRVEADLVDDPVEAPYMHYRPIAGGD